jgi:hypothetical protein
MPGRRVIAAGVAKATVIRIANALTAGRVRKRVWTNGLAAFVNERAAMQTTVVSLHVLSK